MTLLSICQQISNEAGALAPSTIINNSTEDAVVLLALAQTTGRTLARKPWKILEAEGTITTVAAQEAYTLATDFSRMIPDTMWNRTDQARADGGLTPQRWQFHKSAVGGEASIGDRFRITQESGVKKVLIDPTPTEVETFAYEYFSTSWCEDSAGTGQSAWAADDDVPRVPEDIFILEMKWRFLNRLGVSYLEEKAEADRETRIALAQEGGSPTISMARRDRGFITHIPDTGAG